MTVEELQMRALKRLDEDGISPRFWTPVEFLAALNEAQRFFTLLTLCLETVANYALGAGLTFHSMGATYPDWIVPLRVLAHATQARLRPARLTELEARSATWQSATGTPERYAALGFDLLALWPHPSGDATSLDITYAKAPVALTLPSSVPEIPAEYHASLIDYAIPRLCLKEGAQQLAKTLPRFERFLGDAGKLGQHVRGRNIGHGYDRVPIELERFDTSKLLALALNRRESWPTMSPSRQA